MASLVIKALPDSVHRLLKKRAERNRRSMTQEAVVILEQALLDVPPVKLPKPIKPLREITGDMVASAIREGRE